MTTYLPIESGLDRAAFQLDSINDYYVFNDTFAIENLDADYVDNFAPANVFVTLDDADFACENCDRDFATFADNDRALLPVYNESDNCVIHLDELPAATQLYINNILDRQRDAPRGLTSRAASARLPDIIVSTTK